jgi:hypothetical protein
VSAACAAHSAFSSADAAGERSAALVPNNALHGLQNDVSLGAPVQFHFAPQVCSSQSERRMCNTTHMRAAAKQS